jgi:hypothetical protein
VARAPRDAGLSYLQHIVLVHVPTTEHGLAHPAATRRPHAPFWPIHTDALVFTRAPDPTGPSTTTPRGPKDHPPTIAAGADQSRPVAAAQQHVEPLSAPQSRRTEPARPVDPPTTLIPIPPTPATASTPRPLDPVRPATEPAPKPIGTGLLLSGHRRGVRPIGSKRTSTSEVSR